ncbi:MAG: ABC transporter permease [Acidobacteria bacterium]|nr:ABC transporter permease [Acidobacteriota bacterium]
MKLLLRLKSLFQKDHLDDQLSDELAFHLEQQEAELIEKGFTPQQAKLEARRLFGPIASTREECRDKRKTQYLEDLSADTCFTLRSLRKSPTFSLIAILTLALGIGANTAFFSTAYGILFKPLPYPQPRQLVTLDEGMTGVGPVTTLRTLSTTTEYVGYVSSLDLNLFESGEASKLRASRTTFNLAQVLQTNPQLGRWFKQENERPGLHRVAVLSDQLWRTRFNANPNIVGRTITLNERPYEVLGVMPPSFAFPTPQTELWLPIPIDPRNVGEIWGNGNFLPIGRLKPNHTLATAQSEIRPLLDKVRSSFPWRMPDLYGANATVVRHDAALIKQVQPKLLVLAGATFLLLLIACGNVGNLLLARGIHRQREFSLRAALGASNARLLRQLLTENLILVILGGTAGLAIALLLFEALPMVFPKDTPRLEELLSDPTLPLGAAASLAVTILLFTTVPLLGGLSLKPSRHASKFSLTLIGIELALATTLLIGAALMGHTLWQLANQDSGIPATNVTTARIATGPSRCPNPDSCQALLNDLTQTLIQDPAIRSINWTNAAPFDPSFASVASAIEDHPKLPSDPAFVLWQTAATPGYFNTLGIRILAGRAFNDTDQAKSQLVTIISESTARRFWPNQNPIGKRVRPVYDPNWRTIIGVASDASLYSITGYPSWIDGVQYLPLTQSRFLSERNLQLSILLETTNNNWPSQLKQRYPDIVISNIATLGALRDSSIQSQRSTATLLTLFAVLGLILGIAGVHGVIAHRAAQRTKEMGIRMALGARPAQLVRMVLAETFIASTLGTSAVIVAAWLLSRYLKSLVFGITIHDPLAFTLSPAILILAATIAASIPAIRATRTDPALTLRQD